jgi:ppGpp synthetase/RelA/SpoT-type nucleotidyltranferase
MLDRAAANSEQLADAYEILNNWRGSHSFPLNTMQNGLRLHVSRLSDEFVVAQRLKRIPSILKKLERFPGMQLARMQDIGGCRAVVPSIGDVFALRESLLSSRMRHRLANEKNYIAYPKDSGYRSVHLVYQYQSDRNSTYNGLAIEVQMRSQLQHAWATAVETMGTFLRSALKASEGPEDWLEFFRQVSSAFAVVEGTAPVPETISDRAALRKFVSSESKRLNVIPRLTAFGNAVRAIEDNQLRNFHYYLLVLKPAGEMRSLSIRGYGANQIAQAAADYTEIEREIRDDEFSDAVLVSVDSVKSLRQAYPNYFLDTSFFITKLRDVLRSPLRKASA